ncbi:MAG: hypothetical protein QOD86_1320 [Miltoncostaeaceae bacterium]|nr:hypothetical protein [Miltoncostaeaceae bacterium]
MADQPSGIDEMRRRMERAARRPPPPRRAAGDGPVAVAPAAEVVPEPAPSAPAPSGAAPPSARARTARSGAARTRRAPGAGEGGGVDGPEPERLAADLPPVNLAIRVRRPLDERLVELIHQLRRAGVRTSKVELIEMLLWELPEAAPALTERLARFRRFAARGPGAPLA